MLQIYNSIAQTKQLFTPIVPGKINLYVCGMTVYDYCHIGHARSMLVFDVIVRYLRHRGYDVNYVRNITDVDDKIIMRALEEQMNSKDLAEQFIQAMHEDEKALGILSPDYEPKATEHMPQMIELIERLLANKHAYIANNGDVYFDVRSFNNYGQLSHHNLDNLKKAVRIEINDVKRDPLDFVLWKLAKKNEPYWSSPWGDGRPGWHIECSAMSTDLLGQPFDIHGGGLDLKFPHHENEIAQSEAACHQKFVNYWMHVGLLQVNGEKMSKSLKNFFTIREVLAEHHPEVIRYLMISGHYRSPINYSAENLSQSYNALQHLYLALRDFATVEEDMNELARGYRQKFYAAMDNDFNTPEGLAVLFDLSHAIHRLREEQQLSKAASLATLLAKLGQVLGILQESPQVFLQGSILDEQVEEVNRLIAARNEARRDKNWQRADEIRQQLAEMKVVIEDTPNGTHWRSEK